VHNTLAPSTPINILRCQLRIAKIPSWQTLQPMICCVSRGRNLPDMVSISVGPQEDVVISSRPRQFYPLEHYWNEHSYDNHSHKRLASPKRFPGFLLNLWVRTHIYFNVPDRYGYVSCVMVIIDTFSYLLYARLKYTG